MRARALAALVTFAVLCAGAARADPGIVLEAVAVRDTGGFAPGVAALALRAPRGWTRDGGLRWTANADCVAMPVSAVFAAARGDGLAGFEILPRVMRAWSNDPEVNGQYARAASNDGAGCLSPARRFGVQAYMDEVFLGVHRAHRPDARILEARRLTAIADRIEARLAAEIGPAAFDRLRDMGGRAEIYGDAGIFDIGYAVAGRAVRERVFVSIAINEIALPRPDGGAVERVSGFTDKVVSWFAPEDEFDALAPVFDFMLVSAAWNRGWTDAVARTIRVLGPEVDGGPMVVHRRNAGAAGPELGRVVPTPAGGAAPIEPGLRAPVDYAPPRRAAVNPWTGAVVETPADAGAAFYANAANDILIAGPGAAPDPAVWAPLTPGE